MFNYEILYLIGFGILAIGMGFGLSFLMKKYNLKTEDIINGVNLTETITILMKNMAKELGFGNEEEVAKVTEIISDSLTYVKTLPQTTSKEDKISNAIFYVKELGKSLNIEADSDRLMIITTLITLAFNLIETLEKK